MIDAYTHLDLTCANPIDDMKARMAQAGIEKALAVETWKGGNLSWLHRMASDYPLCEKNMYTQYMHLAQDWVRRIDPGWSPRLEHSWSCGF
ncbi:MAG: hypothetical protein P4N24_06560 [Acidobacteriota bacterium]|nr:hypothetical protein [Acidobacteriota bacterium]